MFIHLNACPFVKDHLLVSNSVPEPLEARGRRERETEPCGTYSLEDALIKVFEAGC